MEGSTEKQPKSESERILLFLEHVGKLKHIKRTGWLFYNISNPESVAGHMYRMAVMSFLLNSTDEVNKSRCVELALAHDLAECIVGDITPRCGIDPDEKHARERSAIDFLTTLVEGRGNHLKSLYEEYEKQVTPEAKLVKEFDRLDMMLQAFEYEKSENCPGELECFFDACEGKFSSSFVLPLVTEIKKQRSCLLLNKHK